MHVQRSLHYCIKIALQFCFGSVFTSTIEGHKCISLVKLFVFLFVCLFVHKRKLAITRHCSSDIPRKPSKHNVCRKCVSYQDIFEYKTRFKQAFSCWTIISCTSILIFSRSRKAALVCVCSSRAFLASLDFFAEALFFLLRSQ